MKLCTTLQKKVLDLENELKRTKTAQQTKIDGLERRVKKLEKKHRSRTHKLKRLYKVGLTVKVISSPDDETLDKGDTSKQGRKDEIDADEDIALEEVVEVVTIAKLLIDIVVDVAQVTTAIADIPVSVAETIVTTASIVTIQSTKTNVKVAQASKRKRVLIQEPEETTTTKTTSSQQPQVQDKGKGKAKLTEEPEMPKNRKHQISADKELAEKLQAEMQAEINEHDRLARERAQKEQEANDALINTWDDIQAKIDVDAQLAQRLHEEKQLQFTDAEKAKLFMEFIEKRRKFFVAKRDKERRNKPHTKAQQRSIMSTYLKNVDGWKIKSLKKKSFAEIQELFDKAIKIINNFVDFKTELVEESTNKDEEETTQESSSKREGDELEQERSKKQKVKDDKESEELKKCLEIIPDDGDDVTIDATPLSSKSQTIVDYKIYKEGKKNYF
nr:hypothetical protein [Tanacetum cinerariifolium]